MAVIAGCLCSPPSPAAQAACGLADLIQGGAGVEEVSDWFDWGGEKAAINRSCPENNRTPMEESVLRLDLDLLNLLFAEGGDADAIGYHVFHNLAFWASRYDVNRFGWPTDQDPIEAVPPVLEVLLENGLDPNRHLGDQTSSTAASTFAYFLNKQTKLTAQSSGYIPTRHALRRCLRVFYESANMSEARYQGQPLVLYVNYWDRPYLARLGTDLSAAFGYARGHGLQHDLNQLLSMTNGVFDGEPVFPLIVPDGDRLRLLDPRDQTVFRLHENIVPYISALTAGRTRWLPARRSDRFEYDEANQSWSLPPDAGNTAIFNLQLRYTP